jgi:hypothetical protein
MGVSSITSERSSAAMVAIVWFGVVFFVVCGLVCEGVERSVKWWWMN